MLEGGRRGGGDAAMREGVVEENLPHDPEAKELPLQLKHGKYTRLARLYGF